MIEMKDVVDVQFKAYMYETLNGWLSDVVDIYEESKGKVISIEFSKMVQTFIDTVLMDSVIVKSIPLSENRGLDSKSCLILYEKKSLIDGVFMCQAIEQINCREFDQWLMTVEIGGVK